jgi:hypothetical protein
VTRFGSRFAIDDPAEIDTLDELPPGITLVQFRRRLDDDRYRRLGRLLAGRPEVGLRVFASPDITDLELLRFFPSLRSFQVDAMWDRLSSLDGLRHLPADLDALGIGTTKRPMSLAGLARFGRLRWLAVEGRHRDVEVIGGLHTLESLMLRSVPLEDLALLRSLDKLTSLDLKLGGTTDLRLLPRVGRLERLEIWQVRGLSDVSPIGEVRTLRSLFLQALPRVRTLPAFEALTALRDVTLHTMKGVTDLTPLATAPALETLSLIAMGHLEPADLRPLIGHPTLRRGLWNIGSMRKTYEAHDVLPIAPEPFGYADWKVGVPYRTILKAWLAAVQIGTREIGGRMVIDPDRAAAAPRPR